jgi:hypothetical protein
MAHQSPACARRCGSGKLPENARSAEVAGLFDHSLDTLFTK